MTKKGKKKDNSRTVALNRKARFEYELGEKFVAGIELEGWEVKSARSGKASITESYVIQKDQQLWLLGSRFDPLLQAAATDPDATRTRRLLLNRKEISYISKTIETKSYTCIPLSLFWTKAWLKCELRLAKGKKLHDKRQTIKEREQVRESEAAIKRFN